MCGSRHPLLRSTVSLLRPQITTRCAQSSSHSLGASWEEDILFQNPLHIVSGMSMCSVKCVVVIVVLLLSVDVGRSWFAGCGRQASLHFPFINSKHYLLWGRSCVCVVLLPLRTSTARFLLISYIPSLVKRMWLRAAWHQLWAPFLPCWPTTFTFLGQYDSVLFLITLCLSVWHIFFFQIKGTAKRSRSKHGIGEAKATTWRYV